MLRQRPSPALASRWLAGAGVATLVALVLALAASARPPAAGSVPGNYDWPVRPFDRPHPVRAYLGDPRMRLDSKTFHTGIDISVSSPETPVFAVEPGTVRFLDSTAIAVRSGARTLQYWHITPAVRRRQYVRRHALLGWTLPAFNHLHLSELVRGTLVNPLRPEGLVPFDDNTPPTTSRVEFWRAGATLETAPVHGMVDIVADSFDTAADVEPRPWPVAPALIRWRITIGDKLVGAWQVAVDFRGGVPSSPWFALVYAPTTRPNHLGRPGRFRFYLARDWNSARAPNGKNLLEVEVSDMRGNTSVAAFPFNVAN